MTHATASARRTDVRPRPWLGRAVRGLVGTALLLHGALHLLGAASGLLGQRVESLHRVSGPAVGALWLVAGALVMAAAVGLLAGRRRWWTVGAAALLVSPVAVLTDWSEASFGTAANLLLLLAVAHGWAAEGPRSRRERFRRAAASALAGPPAAAGGDRRPGPGVHPGVVVTEHDLAALPPALATYLRRSGAVGQPHVRAVRAQLTGRIRGGPTHPWMPFTVEQVDTVGASMQRHFRMDAVMRGLPVDVLHTFADGHAAMEVALCSVLPLVNRHGPDLDRAETVTLFNDLCVLAPAALLDVPVVWRQRDPHRVSGVFTHGSHTVQADLLFDADGDLVDFVSDDRLEANPDGTFVPRGWSTPLRAHRDFGGRRLPATGEAWWHTADPDGSFCYIELTVRTLVTLGAGETAHVLVGTGE
ncbi:DUF6544 family protein [Cellulomonas sp. NTE-D12]|uniref:DUF6544 family protein n=1 Tax=Cellulomonas sp. NTE-D12 TaxID=2962632 RepID=UPI003081B503|nr:hypothetical protein CELD12_07510 [Cellulomonas sp. NTE-D12]